MTADAEKHSADHGCERYATLLGELDCEGAGYLKHAQEPVYLSKVKLVERTRPDKACSVKQSGNWANQSQKFVVIQLLNRLTKLFVRVDAVIPKNYFQIEAIIKWAKINTYG